MGVFNVEYRIPVAGPLSHAGFYDVGLNRASRPGSLGSLGATTVELIRSSNSVIRSSTGVEVQFLLPVVSAPLRLIFAYNPQILDVTANVGTHSAPSQGPASGDQVHNRAQFLI